MILESVFNLFKTALFALFSFINIPDLPPEISSVVIRIMAYLNAGFRFVLYFFDVNVLIGLLPFVIILINFDHVYKLVMFVVRKIPFLGIK